jgi:hypothetical protein
MDSLLTALEEKLSHRETEEREGFWTGHSIFQVPMRILSYRGSVEAMVLLYLYERANRISFFSEQPVLIEVPVSEKKIAKRTEHSERAVRQAIAALDADRCIRVVHTRNAKGRVQTSVYLLLHSQTGKPLQCFPRLHGICHQNSDRPFITCPKETRDKLKGMQKAGRQVYLAALSLVSAKMNTTLSVNRDEWQTETMLGIDAFYDGLRECKKAKLLVFKKGTLTLLDPRTGERSTRTKQTLVYDKNTNWRFPLDDITAAQWEAVIRRLLKRELVNGASGWTVSGADDLCPLCHAARGFRVNYEDAKYSCKECGSYGRLGQLVHRLLRVTQWEHVRQYIRETIALNRNPHAEI